MELDLFLYETKAYSSVIAKIKKKTNARMVRINKSIKIEEAKLKIHMAIIGKLRNKIALNVE